jgi:hypothetical protein
MFGLLFVLMATGRLWTWAQVRELKEDRDRWREAAETSLPVAESTATVVAEMAGLLRSLDARIAHEQGQRRSEEESPR